MKCDFQVGDEIVCIANEVPPYCIFSGPAPEVGKVYHIESMIVCPEPPLPGWDVGIALVEIPGEFRGWRIRFPNIWFRRVEKPKTATDIEVFRRIDREVFDKSKVNA